MEQVGKTIGKLSSHTLLDKFRFFEWTVFNFIIGNNDMHLKNFSMILSDDEWVLSPAYDLLNVKIILPKDEDETTLLLGEKRKIKIENISNDLHQYYNSMKNKWIVSLNVFQNGCPKQKNAYKIHFLQKN